MAEQFIQSPPDSPGGKHVQMVMQNDTVNDIYTQVNMIADRNDHKKRVAVESNGAIRTAFVNGNPRFDIFGRTTVSEANLMGMYKFYHADYAKQFMKTEVGGGVVSHDPVLQCIKLACGTASGDKAEYHSHRHYHYRPGNTMGLLMTTNAGDLGKVDVRRQFGWITPDNGIYFEWDGATMQVVIHNGNLDTFEKVPQASWNEDNLLGGNDDANLSGATLDISKDNIWWVEFQYLGAGAVRFGTWVNGVEVVCHTIGHYNGLDRPYLSSPSMSFGVSQENMGVVGSASEFHVFCAVITNDGYDEYDTKPVSFGAEKTLTTTGFVPIVSFRPTELKHGVDNRTRLLPRMISALAVGGDIELIAEITPTLTSATWLTTKGNIELDTGATDSVLGAGEIESVGHVIASGRNETISLDDVFLLHKDGVSRLYDVSLSDHITISGRLISAGSANAVLRINAVEIE